MQAKLLELISKYLLLPLLRDGVMWVVNSFRAWYQNRQEMKRRKQAEKENIEKAEEYESSTNNESTDSFNQLP